MPQTASISQPLQWTATRRTHPYPDDCKEIKQHIHFMALRTQKTGSTSLAGQTSKKSITCTAVIATPVASDSDPTWVYLQFFIGTLGKALMNVHVI